MASELKYELTVAEKIRDLFKAAFGDGFKLYRVGDPVLPSQSELPAVYITETSVDISQDATGYDKILHNIFIQIVLNKKDELGRPKDGNTLDTVIDNWLYGRDINTSMYSTRSVMGVLRYNFTLDGLAVNNIGRAKKGVVTRPEEVVTAEGQLEVEIEELQPVNNRV